VKRRATNTKTTRVIPAREVLLAAILPLGVTAGLRAATTDTYSAPSGNWSDPANWSLGRVPINTDTVFLTNGPNGTFGNVTVSFDPDATSGTGLASVTIQGTNGGVVTLSQDANTFNVNATEYVGFSPGATGALLISGGNHTVIQQTFGSSGIFLGYNTGATGNATLSGLATLFVKDSLYIGNSGTGTFLQSAGTNTVGVLATGLNPTGDGSYTFSGGTLSVNLQEVAGKGVGHFTQSGGFYSGTQLNMAATAGSTGTVNLSAGTFALTNTEKIGQSGYGEFDQTGGTNSCTSQLLLGENSTGTGVYNLSSGTLSISGLPSLGNNELIGYNGVGTLTQTDGTHSVQGAIEIGVANNPTAGRGTLNLQGGSLSASEMDLNLSTGTSAVVNQTGGSNTIGGDLVIGDLAGSRCEYTLGGTGSLTVSNNAYVGKLGRALFSQTGGSANVARDLFIGQNSSGTSSISAGTLDVGGSEFVGSVGRGILLQSGGDHSINGTGTNGLYLALNPASTGSATLSGGLLSVASSEYVGYRGRATFTQSAGTHTIGSSLVISANPGTSTGSLNLQGGSLTAAALQINAGGSLTQTGGSLTITGPATNHAALSLLAGTSSFGPLSGTGTLTIGSPTGTSTASTTLTSFSQSTLTIDSTGTLTLSPNTPRATNTATTLVINPGGTLDLTRNDLLVDRTLTPPATIRALLVSGYSNNTWTGTGIRSSLAQGTNANTFSLGWADGGASPNVDGLPTNQILVRYTLRGDANLDGKVDIQDLLRFRANAGTTNQAQWWQADFTYDGKVDIQDLLAFRANAGAPPVPSDVQFSDLLADTFDYVSAVPEPAATSLFALGGTLALLNRRRRHTRP